MKPKNAVLDTNILIRFLTGDNPVQTNQVERLFQNAHLKTLEVPDVVIVEVIYVLISKYQLSKEDITEKMRSLITFPAFLVNGSVISRALEIFEEKNISFVDAYLCSLAQEKKQVLYSFDRELKKVPSTEVKVP